MTYFTPAIDKYFASWILPDTWYTDSDIEYKFWRFVISIHRLSKPIKARQLDLDDPSLANFTDHQKKRFSKIWARNPRTYDKKAFKKKILCAIKRNHPNFDEKYAEELITELTNKAMIVLDALYYAKVAGFPSRRYEVEKKDWPLK